MSTKTEAKSEVIVKTSAKVVAAIKAQVIVEAQALGKVAFTAKTIRQEADRLGYDEKQARQMTTLAWREAKGFKGTEDQTKDFDLRCRPDVSKVIALAFPVATHEKDTQKAMAFNEKLGDQKHGRISSGKMLSIARGNLTYEDALAGKSAQKTAKTPEPGKVKKLTLATLEDELAGIRARFCKPGIANPEQMREIAERVFCDGAYKPAEKE